MVFQQKASSPNWILKMLGSVSVQMLPLSTDFYDMTSKQV